MAVRCVSETGDQRLYDLAMHAQIRGLHIEKPGIGKKLRIH